MSSWLGVAVVAVAVVTLVVRRLTVGEPLNARELCVPPLALTGIGVYTVARTGHLTGTDIAWLVAGSVVGLAFGAFRGTTVRVFVRQGVLWQRYTGRTLLVWVVSIGVNAGLGLLAVSLGMHEAARPVTLSIGVGLLGEMITIGLRALSVGAPFAPQTRESSDRVGDRR